MARSTTKDAQDLFHSLRSAYVATPTNLKVHHSHFVLIFVLDHWICFETEITLMFLFELIFRRSSTCMFVSRSSQLWSRYSMLCSCFNSLLDPCFSIRLCMWVQICEFWCSWLREFGCNPKSLSYMFRIGLILLICRFKNCIFKLTVQLERLWSFDILDLQFGYSIHHYVVECLFALSVYN